MKAIIEQVEKMAQDDPEPKPLCWIETGGVDHGNNYCPDCADKVMAWLTDGGEQPEFGEHEEHPMWAAIAQYLPEWIGQGLWTPGPIENYVRGGRHYDAKSDGPRNCELCGCMLDVTLTRCGIMSELEHFETCDNLDGQWREFLNVIQSGDESGWETQAVKDRVVALAVKHLPKYPAGVLT